METFDNERSNVKDFLSHPKTKQANLFSVPPSKAAQLSDAEKEVVDVGYKHLPTMNAACWRAIEQGNQPPVLFSFNDTWSRIVTSGDGYPLAQPVTLEILRHHLSNWACWCKDNSTNPVIPPKDVVADVMATPELRLPVLRRIVTVPVFGADGSLPTAPGYHPESGNYYAPRPDFVALPVPETISEDDVTDAREFLTEELLCDFPFATPADKANAIALFLLPFVRDFIAGPTPNHLIDASVPGSGKTLLADVLMFATLGTPVPHMSEIRNDEELSKLITAFLMSGQSVAMFDNINNVVHSGLLAKAWTDSVWQGRLLGTNTNKNIPVRCVWIMTGNNMQMSSENVRRSVRIRLVPDTDKPQHRTGFKIENIKAFIREHRPRLVQCAHILVGYWLQQGRPIATDNLRAMGSYEDWVSVMSGILNAIGLPDFLSNVEAFHNVADEETDARALFCANWFSWANAPGYSLTRQEVSAADLLPIAQATDGFYLPKKDSEKSLQTYLGRWLMRHNETLVCFKDEDGSEIRYKIAFRKGRLGKLWKIEVFHR